MSFQKIVLAAAFSLAPASIALASDADIWTSANTYEDGGVQSITSGSAAARGAYFACIDDQLRVAVGVEPGNVGTMLERTSSRTRTYEIKTTIGDGETFESKWAYKPSLKVAIAQDSVTPRKLYNAAVRGDTISMKLPGKSQFDITLPAVNADFTSFANNCGVTNPR